jgi:hypothetical protein
MNKFFGDYAILAVSFGLAPSEPLAGYRWRSSINHVPVKGRGHSVRDVRVAQCSTGLPTAPCQVRKRENAPPQIAPEPGEAGIAEWGAAALGRSSEQRKAGKASVREQSEQLWGLGLA